MDDSQDLDYIQNNGSQRRMSSQGRRTGMERTLNQLSEKDIQHKVKDLVRLALCAERRRVPLRRTDVSEKVLMEHSRAFHAIFEKAQEQLRGVFGLEMVQIPARERAFKMGASASRRAAVSKDKSSTQAYILRSTLPSNLRQLALIDWGDDSAWLGFTMVVLGLIYVNDCSLSEERLHALMRKLGVTKQAHPQLESLDAALARMVKTGYLDRLTCTDGNEQDGAQYEYRWGPRAKVEVDEAELVQFIVKIFGDQAAPDLSESVQRASGKTAADSSTT